MAFTLKNNKNETNFKCNFIKNKSLLFFNKKYDLIKFLNYFISYK